MFLANALPAMMKACRCSRFSICRKRITLALENCGSSSTCWKRSGYHSTVPCQDCFACYFCACRGWLVKFASHHFASQHYVYLSALPLGWVGLVYFSPRSHKSQPCHSAFCDCKAKLLVTARLQPSSARVCRSFFSCDAPALV